MNVIYEKMFLKLFYENNDKLLKKNSICGIDNVIDRRIF